MNHAAYEARLHQERRFQERMGTLVGVPFAIIAVPSWGGAVLVFLAISPLTAILVAVPGFLALGVSAGLYVLLVKRSQAREAQIRRRYEEARRNT